MWKSKLENKDLGCFCIYFFQIIKEGYAYWRKSIPKKNQKGPKNTVAQDTILPVFFPNAFFFFLSFNHLLIHFVNTFFGHHAGQCLSWKTLVTRIVHPVLYLFSLFTTRLLSDSVSSPICEYVMGMSAKLFNYLPVWIVN